MAQEEEKVEINLEFYNGEKFSCFNGKYFYKPVSLQDNKIVYPCWKCKHFSKVENEWSGIGIGGYVGGSIFRSEWPGVKHLESITIKCLKFNLEKIIKF
ncbi:MAG: hypothetical protein QXU74_02915 [Candidatus Aenigmatarchaeota archaeon]